MGNSLVNNQIIEGVVFQPLKQFKDDRGAVMHHLNYKSPTFKGFEEVYISKTFSGFIKAWKMHLKMTQNFCVPIGAFKFVIFDYRENSITKNYINEFYLDDDLSYSLLTVPPGVYYGFQCLSNCSGLIVNLSNLLFDPTEVVRLELENEIIPYSDWRD